MKAAIICAQGLEECEALLTYDLLHRANIQVELLGLDSQITSSHNVTFNTHKLLKEVDIMDYDCLILPGGIPGTNNLEDSKDVQNAIDLFVNNNKLIAAVCAAPSILNHKGLLEDKKFTCYPGFECGLTSTKEKTVIVKVDDNAKLEFSRSAIAAVETDKPAESDKAKKDKKDSESASGADKTETESK